MIGFILGILTCIAIGGVSYLSYKLGMRHHVKQDVTLTEQEKNKLDHLKELNEGMNKVLNYDMTTARNHYSKG